MPTEPGWYLDPESGQHRYWDGTTWAEMTAEEQAGEAGEAGEQSDTTTTD